MKTDESFMQMNYRGPFYQYGLTLISNSTMMLMK